MKHLLDTISEVAFSTLDLKKCTLTVGGVKVKFGEGNLTWSEAQVVEYIKDRGLLDDVREGDQEPMPVNFEARWEEIDGGSLVSAIKGLGSEASSDDDDCRPYACDLVFTYTPNCGASGSDYPGGSLTFPDFRYENLAFDAKAGTISCSGKCNAIEPIRGG